MGLGKTRHIRVQYLWIQERVHAGDLKVRKIGTDKNPADLLTKPLTVEIMKKHLEKMQMEFRSGRADNGLELHSLETNSDKWVQSMEGAVSLDEGVDNESRIVLHDACSNELCAILNKTVLNKFMNEYASEDGAIVRKHNQIHEVLFAR